MIWVAINDISQCWTQYYSVQYPLMSFFFLVTVRVVLWIWASNMVAKPGFNRLELNHLSLLYGDTTCHKSFECFPPVMVGSIPKAWLTYFFHGTPNLEDVLFGSFSIHWSLFIMLGSLVIWRDANLDPWWFQAYPFFVQSLAEQFG